MKMTGILEKIQKQTDSEKLQIRDIVEILEDQGFGPLLLVPAIIVILPTGAIPGVPAIAALLIILLTGQLALGRKNPWLPRRLADYEIDKKKFNKGVRKISYFTRKIDRLFKPRLQFMFTPIAVRVIAGVCVLLALFMVPVGFIPFAVIIPAFAIAFLALGLSVRDGLVIAIGMLVAVAGLPATLFWLA